MCTKTKSLSPDCRCYLFDSRIHRNGTFKSPNYNMMYETGEQCEYCAYCIYNFRLSRDLYPTLQSAKFKYHLDYNQLEKVECSEYVRIFDNLETNELGNDDMYSYELCGNLDEISQHHYISKKNILMMEACLSSSDSGNFKSNGFTGKYTFEPKIGKVHSSNHRYTNDGQHVMGTNCDRLMKSPFYEENSSPSMIDRPSQSKSGHLFSPKYPQNYPPNMMCRFYLIGQPYERVILNLKDVQLQSHKNKNNTLPPKGDYLEISEAEKITLISKNTGNTHSSIFSLASIPNSLYHSNNMPILQPIQIIQYVHGKSTNDVQIISKGSNMLITFISNNDGKQSRGFEATYRFVHRNQVKPTIKNHHDSVKINQSPTNRGLSTNHHPNGNTRGTMDPVPPDIVLPAPSIPQQETIQWDRDLAEGTIFSPDYPKVYPPNQLKEYILVAPPTGKVNITLKKFKLDAEKTLSCRTHSGDRLEIYSNLNRTTNPWIVLCGTRIPLKYKFIESLNEFLILRFISDGITSSTEQGFQLNYKFLSGNGYVTTSNPVTTKATNNNISSLFNYRNHQESVQLESNLMDDQRYELFQNFKSIVDYVTNSDNSRQSSDNYQNYRQLVGSKLKKPMNAVSKEATLNRQKKKCSFIIEANYEKRSTAFQNLNFKNTLLQYSKSFYGKNEQFSSLLCKWMLIGAHYQRVQLRFVPNTPVVTDNDDDDDNWRKKKKRKHYDDTQNSSIYPNATMIQSLQMKLNNNDSDAVSGKLYNRPKISLENGRLKPF
ncbi:unnamed protein product [Heterobilharzia americana]|nr:unnamed protein product [Heterobilharzia americana]